MGTSTHWDPSVPVLWLYEDIEPLGSRFWDCLGSSILWDPSVPIYMGTSAHWDPSVPISGSPWGCRSIGIHQFPFPCSYGDIHPLGSISSHFWVSLGMLIHWYPLVPPFTSLWGHPSSSPTVGQLTVGIHPFPFSVPSGSIPTPLCPLGSLQSY